MRAMVSPSDVRRYWLVDPINRVVGRDSPQTYRFSPELGGVIGTLLRQDRSFPGTHVPFGECPSNRRTPSFTCRSDYAGVAMLTLSAVAVSAVATWRISKRNKELVEQTANLAQAPAV